MREGNGGGGHCGAGLRPEIGAQYTRAFSGVAQSTPTRGRAAMSLIADFRAGTSHKLQKACKTSESGAVPPARDRSIRKKVIGHSLRAGSRLCGRGSSLGNADGTLALLQQQAHERGAGLVGPPLVQQGNNLLTQISGIGKTRKLKALQRVLGSRKKELPRRLVRTGAHNGLHYGNTTRNNNTVVVSHEYQRITSCGNLWKTL